MVIKHGWIKWYGLILLPSYEEKLCDSSGDFNVRSLCWKSVNDSFKSLKFSCRNEIWRIRLLLQCFFLSSISCFWHFQNGQVWHIHQAFYPLTTFLSVNYHGKLSSLILCPTFVISNWYPVADFPVWPPRKSSSLAIQNLVKEQLQQLSLRQIGSLTIFRWEGFFLTDYNFHSTKMKNRARPQIWKDHPWSMFNSLEKRSKESEAEKKNFQMSKMGGY